MKTIQISPFFLLAIFTIIFPPWSCVVIPVTSESGSGADAVEEVVTLEYCIINNSTILRLDTGEYLEVIYKRDSALVVTLNDLQTTMTVSRLNNEPVCSMDNSPGIIIIPTFLYVFMSVWLAIMLSVTGYNIAIHLLFKELRNSFGMLLMLYSFFLAGQSICVFMITTLIYQFHISLHYICYVIKMVFIATDVGYDATAMCVLAHCAYHLWQSYKMIPHNPSIDKVLSRRYFGYIFGSIVASMCVILAYDIGINKQKFDVSCGQDDSAFDALVRISFTVVSINRLIQIALFIVYLYCWYKLRIPQDITGHKINPKLFRIAIAMGVTATFAKLFFIFNWLLVQTTDFELSALAGTISSIMLLIQHCIIVGLFRWVKNVYRALCKKQVEGET